MTTPSLRARLDRLDDRQLRQLMYFLCGSASVGDPRVGRWFEERVRDGVEWLQGKRGRNEDEAGNRN